MLIGILDYMQSFKLKKPFLVHPKTLLSFCKMYVTYNYFDGNRFQSEVVNGSDWQMEDCKFESMSINFSKYYLDISTSCQPAKSSSMICTIMVKKSGKPILANHDCMTLPFLNYQRKRTNPLFHKRVILSIFIHVNLSYSKNLFLTY